MDGQSLLQSCASATKKSKIKRRKKTEKKEKEKERRKKWERKESGKKVRLFCPNYTEKFERKRKKKK